MVISNTMRSELIAVALGAATAVLITVVRPGWAQDPVASAVSIHNFTFTPQTLTVKAGTTVTWNNKDDIPHGIASDNNAFRRSKALDTDDKFAFMFTTPGTYQYFCYLHPYMKGTIVVQPSSG